MKMNRQSRTFVRQVQVDLLALSDDDLFQTIQQWVDGASTEPSRDVPEETRYALGYTLIVVDHLSYSLSTSLIVESEARKQWLAPSPHLLRALLTEMDVKPFLQHVLSLAFQSLHPMYPEWDEGVTFNAHLANHLRRIGMKRRGMTSGKGSP